jgi:pimeloyl-ACP methyl ester carboxylesterase
MDSPRGGSSHSFRDYAPLSEMPTLRTLRREGCTIAYELMGPGAGETVVLLHGFGMSRESLRPLAASLRECGAAVRTLLPDSRGHGDTRAPEDDDAYRYAAMRDDVCALLELEAPSGGHLVGHSMGGQIALMAALAQPELVHSLTVIGGGPCRAVSDGREKKAWQRAAGSFERATRAELWSSLESAAPTEAAELTAECLYGGARGQDLARVVRGGFLHVEDNDDACRQLDRPTLVIAGANDRTWLGPSRRLAELIPGSELEVVEGTGHLVHLERPEECTRWISDHTRGTQS